MSAERILQSGERVVIDNTAPGQIIVKVARVGERNCIICGMPAIQRLTVVDEPDHTIAAVCGKHWDNLSWRRIEQGSK